MPVAFTLNEIVGPEHEGPITEQITRCLGGHGLLIADAAPGSISLVGTSPALALLVNRLRHQPHPRGVLRHRIVQAALRLPQRPRRLRTEMLLNAAVVLENLAIEADGLLDENRGTSSLRSKWLLIEKMNPDNGEGGNQHD
ncbi:MAG: hypothetical protein IT445_17285 [Phycisphaeraceae bacterium]|nr:hypothetical protein [Phycisphaeraceae bacterium]